MTEQEGALDSAVGLVGLWGGIKASGVIARRNLLQVRSDIEQLVGMTLQPLMFVLLFVYVFGGAVAHSPQRYLSYALPGILVQSLSFNGFQTALGLNVDFQRGLVDRFRSLPIPRASVIAGRVLADAVRAAWSIVVIMVFGFAIGYRPAGSVPSVVAGLAIAGLFGVALCWPMALVGISLRSPEAVNSGGFMVMMPLTFASSALVPVASMPPVLRTFAAVNPVTVVIDATRSLADGTPGNGSVAGAVLWSAAITAVFAPLAIARYQRRT